MISQVTDLTDNDIPLRLLALKSTLLYMCTCWVEPLSWLYH